MDNNLYKTVSYKLLEHRNRVDLTQEKIAEMLDISQSHYAKLENGQRLPSLKVLSSWAKVFGVKMGDLIETDEAVDEPSLIVKDNIMFMLKDKSLYELELIEHLLQAFLEDLSKAKKIYIEEFVKEKSSLEKKYKNQ